ncbi:MAG: VOC family protein [Pseudomonadota bacterium]
MIDHIGIFVADLERSRAFYAAALEPLGIALLMTVPGEITDTGRTSLGFGRDPKPFFWLGDGGAGGQGVHIAFVTDSRAEVDAFHAAALAAGGRDNGAPGIRAQYHPTYYGAFVIDPDGNNIEAVCHRPE